jgi:ribosomal protein S18 acetylase RimI-like enzyme
VRTRANIRRATIKDLPALIDLETRGFRADHFSPGQFKYLLTRAHGHVLIVEFKRKVAGAAIMLWRRGRTVARLYNIVIDPTLQGKGLGARLLEACEREAFRQGYRKISLEVRTDNKAAIAFYRYHGYTLKETLPRYYSGKASGYRMVKSLPGSAFKDIKLDVPYYGQTLEFTCGSACLMMAFKYFKPGVKLNRTLELRLWREATLIFMTAGFGGTGPFGLALAAQSRNFPVRLVLSAKQTPFFSSVRTRGKREVIKLVHDDLKRQALASGVRAEYYDFAIDDISAEMHKGKLAIVLISTYHLHGDRAPHWVLITGLDSEYVYFHDPYHKFYDKKPRLPVHVKVHIDDFRKMRRYGKDLYKCALFIGAPRMKT